VRWAWSALAKGMTESGCGDAPHIFERPWGGYPPQGRGPWRGRGGAAPPTPTRVYLPLQGPRATSSKRASTSLGPQAQPHVLQLRSNTVATGLYHQLPRGRFLPLSLGWITLLVKPFSRDGLGVLLRHRSLTPWVQERRNYYARKHHSKLMLSVKHLHAT